MEINNKSSRLLQMLHRVKIKALGTDKKRFARRQLNVDVCGEEEKWGNGWRDLDMCWLLHHEERMLDWQQIFSSYVCGKLHSSLPTWLAFEGCCIQFWVLADIWDYRSEQFSWDFDWLFMILCTEDKHDTIYIQRKFSPSLFNIPTTFAKHRCLTGALKTFLDFHKTFTPFSYL